MAQAENPSPLADGTGDRAQASQLCIDCGLCCTGVVHDADALDADEVVPAAELGLALMQAHGRTGWSFPYAALQGTRCGIFGRRPRCCARYRCQVLIDLLDGKLTFDAAVAHTRRATQLFVDMLAVRPAKVSIDDTKVMARNRLWTPALREVADKATILQLYIDRHFRKPDEVKLFPAADPGDPEA